MGRWSKELVLAEIMGEAIGRELKASMPSPETFKLVETFPIPDSHQSVTAPALKKTRIFYFKVPKGNIAFITHIANEYWTDDLLYWRIDGKLIFSPNIQRMLGDVHSPTPIQPWYRLPVRDQIVWRVENKDVVDHDYWVVQDGFYLKIEDLARFFSLIGATPVLL